MKSINLCFEVHQPFRLRDYKFFKIGSHEEYFDDFLNSSIIKKVANKCYLPANKILLEQIKRFKGKFKVAFAISGSAIEQFELFAPEVLESFKELANTGCVEFIAETHSHNLASLSSKKEFEKEVKNHIKKYERHFDYTPKVFRNTELIYSNEIGKMVYDLGFKTILTEGADNILSYKSPNYVYSNPSAKGQKILMRNYKLSDDISFRFSNRDWSCWPLTSEKYKQWIENIPKEEKFVNIFMDYETFGEHQRKESGIFDFLAVLPKVFLFDPNFEFVTPSEIAQKNKPVEDINVFYPISWVDEERDLTAWLGNALQKSAFELLYKLSDSVNKLDDYEISREFSYLQSSDHFYYMNTKIYSDGKNHNSFNPYDSPYTAYINYMNVLNDFIIKIGYQENKNATIIDLTDTIKQQEQLISVLEKDIYLLKRRSKQNQKKGK